MDEIERIIKNKFSETAEEIVERFMDAKLILDFNGLLIENVKNNLEQTMDTIAVTIKDKGDNVEEDLSEAIEVLLRNQDETVRLNTIFNTLQKTPNMHEDSSTVENIIRELFENSNFETTICILDKVRKHYNDLYEEEKKQDGEEKC